MMDASDVAALVAAFQFEQQHDVFHTAVVSKASMSSCPECVTMELDSSQNLPQSAMKQGHQVIEEDFM